MAQCRSPWAQVHSSSAGLISTPNAASKRSRRRKPAIQARSVGCAARVSTARRRSAHQLGARSGALRSTMSLAMTGLGARVMSSARNWQSPSDQSSSVRSRGLGTPLIVCASRFPVQKAPPAQRDISATTRSQRSPFAVFTRVPIVRSCQPKTGVPVVATPSAPAACSNRVPSQLRRSARLSSSSVPRDYCGQRAAVPGQGKPCVVRLGAGPTSQFSTSEGTSRRRSRVTVSSWS